LRKRCAYFAQESQNLETPVVDLQLRRAGETREAVGKSVHEVLKVLRHCDRFVVMYRSTLKLPLRELSSCCAGKLDETVTEDRTAGAHND